MDFLPNKVRLAIFYVYYPDISFLQERMIAEGLVRIRAVLAQAAHLAAHRLHLTHTTATTWHQDSHQAILRGQVLAVLNPLVIPRLQAKGTHRLLLNSRAIMVKIRLVYSLLYN